MKALKTIDTYYPNYYHSSWLDFEQKHLLGWQVSPQEASEYQFEFSYNEWLAQRYSFQCSHLAISQGYGAVGIQWHIGGGCYLITNAQDAQKAEHGIELNSYLSKKAAQSLAKISSRVSHLDSLEELVQKYR